MKDGLPLVYWAFRLGWTVLHILMLAAIVTYFLHWALTDSHGAQVLHDWLEWTQHLRRAVSGLIPYPWD